MATQTQVELARLIETVKTAKEEGREVHIDVGCGRGASTSNLQRRLGDEAVVIGIDLDENRLSGGDRFFALRAEDLPEQLEGKLDGASFSCPYPFSEEGGPHWAEVEGRQQVFRAMEKVVRFGGRLEVISEDPGIRALAADTWGADRGSRRRGLGTLNVERTP